MVTDWATWDFDPVHYRMRYAGLANRDDEQLALHFRTVGMEEGRKGRLSREELASIQPSFFNASDYRLRYADLSEMNDGQAVAHFLASGRDEGRVGRLTDEERAALDPALFDAGEYRRKYADIDGASDAEAVQHYLNFGLPEGRVGRLIAGQMDLPTDAQKSGRETVFIVVHEATRTGVPILSWNIARELSRDRNVVVVFLSRGALIPAFQRLDIDVVQLPDGMPDDRREMDALVGRMIDVYAPRVAVVTSVVGYAAVLPFAAQSVPVVLTIHEFAPPSHSPQLVIEAVGDAIRSSEATVYSSEKVRRSYEETYGAELMADAVLLRQGTYERPPSDGAVAKDGPDAGLGTGIVLGVGSVNARKGVEFFVQTAAYAKQLGLPATKKFVWLGSVGSSPDAQEYALSLVEQARSSGVDDRVVFAGEVDDVDAYYAIADAVLVPSRLDPLPNSALDALAAGVPVVSFREAGGIGEIMGTGPTESLVVPYLDSFAAAQRIVALIDNPEVRDELSRACLEVLRGSCLPMPSYADGLISLGARTV